MKNSFQKSSPRKATAWAFSENGTQIRGNGFIEEFDEFLTYDEREPGWINQYLHSGTVYFSRNGVPERNTREFKRDT